jgi:hypothetical protein
LQGSCVLSKRRWDAGFTHHAETIAAYGGPLGAVKGEDNFENLSISRRFEKA